MQFQEGYSGSQNGLDSMSHPDYFSEMGQPDRPTSVEPPCECKQGVSFFEILGLVVSAASVAWAGLLLIGLFIAGPTSPKYTAEQIGNIYNWVFLFSCAALVGISYIIYFFWNRKASK